MKSIIFGSKALITRFVRKKITFLNFVCRMFYKACEKIIKTVEPLQSTVINETVVTFLRPMPSVRWHEASNTPYDVRQIPRLSDH
jgi:hypothetical protein